MFNLVLQAVIFDEIELTDLCLAECSTKNVNHSFQVCFSQGYKIFGKLNIYGNFSGKILKFENSKIITFLYY